MAKGVKKATGCLGEGIAAAWLPAKGFEILERNWRSGRYEIDIVASRQGKLHFIEVKTRRNDRYGLPEAQVGLRKLRNMVEAGTRYLDVHRGWKRVSYDILAIRLQRDGPTELLLIEDVYLP